MNRQAQPLRYLKMIVQKADASERSTTADKCPHEPIRYGVSLQQHQNCDDKYHNYTYAASARNWN
jgi:hypothetical protein